MDLPLTLETLSAIQPYAFLDVLLQQQFARIDYAALGINGHQKTPFSNINDELVLRWCECNPSVRYPLIATAIDAYQKSENESVLSWTALSLQIIAKAPRPMEVLNQFKARFIPNMFSGSLAKIMQDRLPLITQLKTHYDPIVAQWAVTEEKVFQSKISSEKEWDLENSRGRGKEDERFE
jgi:hypothetical protein